MSKRLWVFLVLAAAALVLSGGAVMAMPSLGGPTGIVSVPNALVAPMGDVQLALSYQKVTESVSVPTGPAAAQATSDVESEDYHVWGLQALTGVSDGAELWASYGNASSDFVDNIWGIGGKVQLLREPKDQATVAVFASYQAASFQMYDSSDDQNGHVTKLGLVATKDLTPTGVSGSQWASGGKLLGSAGLLYMKTGGDFEGESLTRPFLGLEYATPDGTSIGAEYRWKDSDLDAKAVWSLALRHNFPKGFSAEIGTTNADPIGFGTDDQNIFVRIGYTFPTGKY